MAKLGERISVLEGRLKQLKAKQTKVEAKKRTVDSRRQRRDELRRKVLVGAIVLEKVEQGELDREKLWGWLDKGLERKEDRELFEGLRNRGNGDVADG